MTGDLGVPTPGGSCEHCDYFVTAPEFVPAVVVEFPHVGQLLLQGDVGIGTGLGHQVPGAVKDYNRRAAPCRWTYDGRPLMAV